MSGADIAEAMATLSDPVAVHANMLRGTIAKPTWEQIKHLYPNDIAAAVKAERERCAQIAYRVCAETRHVTLGDKARDAILKRGAA